MWNHSLSLFADTLLWQSMKQFSVEDKEMLSRVLWYEAEKTIFPQSWVGSLLDTRGVATQVSRWGLKFLREEQGAEDGEAVGRARRTATL